jgi:hypothetical protein
MASFNSPTNSNEQGLLNCDEVNKIIVIKINRLNNKYKIPEVKAISEQVLLAPVSPEPATSFVTAPTPLEKPNPYCHFCP